MNWEDAWLAGLLEGEGNFRMTRTSPTVRINMTDKDTIEKAAVLLGTCTISESVLPSGKTKFAIGVYGERAVSVMKRILPLMGNRRSNDIQNIIYQWDLQHQPVTRNCTRCSLEFQVYYGTCGVSSRRSICYICKGDTPPR